MITKEILKKIAPSAKDSIITDLEKYFDKYLDKYEVNTYLRVCHFLAQCAHESASFQTLEEYASGSAYEGRKDLGNTQPGDGKRYKGRGIIQLTGRSNYQTTGKRLGYDLENNPTLAATGEVSVLTALDYWKSRNLNQYADKDDILTATKKINGGTNGLDDRKACLSRAKSVLKGMDFSTIGKPAVEVPKTVSADSMNIVVAKRGDKSSYVKDLQVMLNNKGAKLITDGDFGSMTEQAVKNFQMWSKLSPTGMIDTNTLNKLMVL